MAGHAEGICRQQKAVRSRDEGNSIPWIYFASYTFSLILLTHISSSGPSSPYILKRPSSSTPPNSDQRNFRKFLHKKDEQCEISHWLGTALKSCIHFCSLWLLLPTICREISRINYVKQSVRPTNTRNGIVRLQFSVCLRLTKFVRYRCEKPIEWTVQVIKYQDNYKRISKSLKTVHYIVVNQANCTEH